jgi:tetratricopeptide (TPR) repeat protein
MRNLSLLLLIVFFSCFTSVVVSQTDVRIRKKDFKNDKQGFEEAWKYLKEGDHYYSVGGMGYKKALVGYSQAYIYNSKNPELNYKLGVACLFSDKKDEASEFFLKALEQNENLTEDILLLTGRSLQYAGKYQEAIGKFNEWLVSPSKKTAENTAIVNKYIGECNSAIIILKDTLRVGINNEGGNLNSDADDYSPVFSSDGGTIYFASRRELPDNRASIYNDIKFDENIFVSKTDTGSWEAASEAGKFLTTKLCETPLFLSDSGDLLYIYKGYEGEGDIFVSENRKGIWRLPFPESSGINSSRPETSFCISPDGNEIFFISDRKKGLGGKDLYSIRKLRGKRWSIPVNAGPSVNTQYDEESISLSEGGDSLWFSSKGHNTLGGFDIFLSVRQPSGEWGVAVNAGFPLNTPWDELFYSPAKDSDSSFFFVSNRSGGFGGLDIYKGRYLPPEPEPVIIPEPAAVAVTDTIRMDTLAVLKPEPVAAQVTIPETKVIYLTGKVADSETGSPVMARLEVIDMITDQVIGITASSDYDGSYRIKLPERHPYIIDSRSSGYLSGMFRVNIPATGTEEFYIQDISLVKIKVGKKVVLNNILFETGKAVINKSSFAELDRLVDLLRDNSRMRIEISGHTDKTGSEPLNFRLSGNRAKAVVDYLTGKGIDSNRLEYKGSGSLQPISDNATAEGRAKNRRVEFKILEF